MSNLMRVYSTHHHHHLSSIDIKKGGEPKLLHLLTPQQFDDQAKSRVHVLLNSTNHAKIKIYVILTKKLYHKFIDFFKIVHNKLATKTRIKNTKKFSKKFFMSKANNSTYPKRVASSLLFAQYNRIAKQNIIMSRISAARLNTLTPCAKNSLRLTQLFQAKKKVDKLIKVYLPLLFFAVHQPSRQSYCVNRWINYTIKLTPFQMKNFNNSTYQLIGKIK
jgi:hypothetical protein